MGRIKGIKNRTIQSANKIVRHLNANTDGRAYRWKDFVLTGKAFGCSPLSVKRYAENLSNFGKAMLKPRAKKKPLNIVPSYNSAASQARKIKKRDISNKEIRRLVKEYLFESRVPTSEFLVNNNIGWNQWNEIMREFQITGVVGGKRVLAFKHYGKLNQKQIIDYCRSTIPGRHSPMRKSVAKLTESERINLHRLKKVIHRYL